MTAVEAEPGSRRLPALAGPEAHRRRLGGASLVDLLRRAWLPLGLLATALALKGIEARGALLYPDGYQYLLMARGISEHLRPVVQLGRGGELFVPNADAALKPLFPAAVALVHLGASWATAARLVTVGAGGAAIALCGLVAARLTSSKALGAFAGLVVLLDPTERYWAAFSSPDQLGQALMLGAVLAILTGRHRVGGALAGFALFARPELGLLLLAGAVALLVTAKHRHASLGFLTAALTVIGLVLAVLRPPLQLGLGEVSIAIAGSVAAAAVAVLAPPRAGVAAGIAGLAFAIAHG
ncbi:MAG TPA: hypothetical protein VG265_11415, partial [Gaiellaceae bacterium]|nr:hypothetical protein [Gaiellaceae bacterium]